MSRQTKFIELKNIFEILHGPKGCLWDKEQTHMSLIKYLREESGEFIDTVKSNKYAHMKEELGDLSTLANPESVDKIKKILYG